MFVLRCTTRGPRIGQFLIAGNCGWKYTNDAEKATVFQGEDDALDWQTSLGKDDWEVIKKPRILKSV